MFTSYIFFAILALTQIAFASNPACLINVTGAQPNPADLSAMCGKNREEILSQIEQECKDSDDKSSAISAYSSSCKEASMPSSKFSVSPAARPHTSPANSNRALATSSYTATTVSAKPDEVMTFSSRVSGYPTSTNKVSIPTPTLKSSPVPIPKDVNGSSQNLPLAVTALVTAGILGIFLL